MDIQNVQRRVTRPERRSARNDGGALGSILRIMAVDNAPRVAAQLLGVRRVSQISTQVCHEVERTCHTARAGPLGVAPWWRQRPCVTRLRPGRRIALFVEQMIDFGWRENMAGKLEDGVIVDKCGLDETFCRIRSVEEGKDN